MPSYGLEKGYDPLLAQARAPADNVPATYAASGSVVNHFMAGFHGSSAIEASTLPAPGEEKTPMRGMRSCEEAAVPALTVARYRRQ